MVSTTIKSFQGVCFERTMTFGNAEFMAGKCKQVVLIKTGKWTLLIILLLFSQSNSAMHLCNPSVKCPKSHWGAYLDLQH